MLRTPIRAIATDMGGTIEDVYRDEAIRMQAARRQQELSGRLDLGPGLELSALQATVLTGIRANTAWRGTSEIK